MSLSFSATGRRRHRPHFGVRFQFDCVCSRQDELLKVPGSMPQFLAKHDIHKVAFGMTIKLAHFHHIMYQTGAFKRKADVRDS